MSLKQSVKWKELYASESLNLMNSGIRTPGVYRGFIVEPAGLMALSISPDLSDHPLSVAVVERGGYNFTVTSGVTETFTVPDGTEGTWYLCIESYYAVLEVGTTEFVLLQSGDVEDYHVVLATIVIPAETTVIDAGMISAYNNTIPSGADRFDNSQVLATRKFALETVGRWAGSGTISQETTLSSQAVGFMFYISDNVLLPSAGECPDGSRIMFVGGGGEVRTQPGNYLFAGGNGASLSGVLVLEPKTFAIVHKLGPTAWEVLEGDAALKYSPMFTSDMSIKGYQYLPNGRIEQWGTIIAGSGVNVSDDFLIEFPNETLNAQSTIIQNQDLPVGTVYIGQVRSLTTTQITIRNLGPLTAEYHYRVIGW